MGTEEPVSLWKTFRQPGYKPVPIPEIVKQVAQFIKDRGHECVEISAFDNKLDWCMQDECKTIKERKLTKDEHDRQMDFAGKLVSEGHECISYKETIPVQIGWCHQTPCTKSK